jgi:predicted PurR-regulated permease PerM
VAGISRVSRSFQILVGLAIVVAFLSWARAVMAPLAVALLLAFVLSIPVGLLERRGLKRLPAVLLVVVLTLLVAVGLGRLVWSGLSGLLSKAPEYREKIVAKIRELQGAGQGELEADLRRAFNFFAEDPTDLGPPGPEAQPQPRGSSPERPIYVWTQPAPWSRLLETVGPAANFVVNAVLVLVLVVFLLVLSDNLRDRLLAVAGTRLVSADRALTDSTRRLSRYLLTQLLVNGSYGVLVGLVLFLIGAVFEYADLCASAPFWGFLIGLLRYVPILGVWAVRLLLFLFCLAAPLPGWGLPLLVVAVLTVIEFSCGNFLEPVLFGRRVGCSPLALLLGAAFWTFLWGPAGLLVSAPLTLSLAVLGRHVPPLRFLAVLLSDDEPLAPDAAYYRRLLVRDRDGADAVARKYLKAHSRQALYEHVLAPALARARRDRRRGELTGDDGAFVFASARALLDGLAAPGGKGGPTAVVALAAGDEADELALTMFGHLLAEAGRRLEAAATEDEAAESLGRRGGPAALLILSLGPGGLGRALARCRRLRARCPRACKVVAVRWGRAGVGERERRRLRQAGADRVGAGLAEAADLLEPFFAAAGGGDPYNKGKGADASPL